MSPCQYLNVLAVVLAITLLGCTIDAVPMLRASSAIDPWTPEENTAINATDLTQDKNQQVQASWQVEMLQAVNNERKKVGLPALCQNRYDHGI